jgi:probable DNA repair protein
MAAVAAGHTILAPNTELAAALFDAVERCLLQSGRDIWPTPRVRDIGSWLLERHARRHLADASLARCLGEFEERELWRSVVQSSELGQTLLEPAGAARAARRARRAIHEYGIPVRAVAADASDEVRVFLGWTQQFEERCRQLGCISADELIAAPECAAERIAWIDSPAWRPVARNWLKGCGPGLPAPAAGSSSPSVRVHAASPTAELAAIGDWAREQLRSIEHFRAWVCVPDLNRRRTDVVDALDAALVPQRFALSESLGGVPYAVAGGTPLAEFAPARLALASLDATADLVSFERFSALLLAPELQASAADAGAAALLDLQLRRRAPSEADLQAWLVLADQVARAQSIGPVGAIQRLHAAMTALRAIRGNHLVSRWVAAWVKFLESGPWAMRHRWSSIEYQSAERFRELLAALAAADSFFGAQPRESAQRILRRAAQGTPFQAQTGIAPIWVSGQLIDPWLNYDGLWVSGLSEERWPPPVEPIPLLPVRLQREYGVIAADAGSQLRSAVGLQRSWAMRASQCVFSHADPADGRAALPSPLVAQIAPPRSSPPTEGALLRPHWRALFDRAPVLERLTDERAPPFAADEHTRGVSTLRAQSRCAFRGFAETRLDAQDLERPVPGFNDRERGELTHHALEHIWSVLRDSDTLRSITPPARSELLHDAVLGALARMCQVRNPGERWRRRERVRLRSVLNKWLDTEREREPFVVETLEEGAQSVRHAGLDFSVRIDRVDRLADGAHVLIDYKTGSANADWRGERPDNPQLPIYALLRPQSLVAVAYGRVNASECGFVAEAERPGIFRPRSQRSQLEGMSSLDALLRVWSRRIENLAADFAAGRAAVAPTIRACKSCRLHGLCRVPAPLEDAVIADD